MPRKTLADFENVLLTASSCFKCRIVQQARPGLKPYWLSPESLRRWNDLQTHMPLLVDDGRQRTHV